jgi:hypothetical protein
MWYLDTMEFNSAIKKNEILSFTSQGMELENIILSKLSKAQKSKNCMFFICRLWTQNKCSNIIRHGSHTKWRTHMREIGKGKET